MKDVIKVSTVAFNAKWGEKERNLNRMTGYIGYVFSCIHGHHLLSLYK